MTQSILKRPFVSYGIYYGVVSIVFFALVYAINFELFGRFFLWMLIGITVLVTFMIMGGMAERKAQMGYLKYFDAVKAMFFIGVLGYAIYILFMVLFTNVIDPEYNKNLGEVIKESTMKMMQNFNVPDEEVDKAMEKMDKEMVNANNPMNYIKQFFGTVVMSIILALICALFVKRNPPEEIIESEVLDRYN